jgi:hypothetical protein
MRSPASPPAPLRWAAAVSIALLVVACTDGDSTATSADSTSVATTVTTTPPATDTTSVSTACPDGDAMVSDGRLIDSERPGADARTIGGITWRRSGECHTITISFTTQDGAPATTPPTVTARILRDVGILRVDTEATSSLIIDQAVENGIVGSLWVPESGEGTRFIDMTLTEPVMGRARVLTSPARLEIELQTGGTPDLGSPLVTETLVVVEPAAGLNEGSVIDVSGYALGPPTEVAFEATLGDEVVESQELTVGAETPLWTQFETTLEMGTDAFDGLRLSGEDGTIAGIPFNR